MLELIGMTPLQLKFPFFESAPKYVDPYPLVQIQDLLLRQSQMHPIDKSLRRPTHHAPSVDGLNQLIVIRR